MKQKLNQIKMIIFDIDGVFSDGDITYLDDGTELKSFDVQDGMGVTLARKAGLKTGIITGRKSSIVERRADELKIDILSQGNFNKLGPYFDIKKKFKFEDHEICYIGDDIPDIPILSLVGFSVAVLNAREEVKSICDYITACKGGRGAVREVIDLILKRQGKFDDLVESLTNVKLP